LSHRALASTILQGLEGQVTRLDGKVALITGGASGIGRACAVRFAQEGAAVCIADLNEAGASEVAGLIAAGSGRALALRVDVTQEPENETMVAGCLDRFGAVDVLVAAAGIAPPPESVLDLSIETFRRVMDVNLYGVLYANRAAARWMVANGRGGSIINMASVASKRPESGAWYGVSKAGVWMLTKVLARELGPSGIRVNALGPWWIETPMTAVLQEDAELRATVINQTPLGRIGRPEEVAAAALFLASDESSYFTGELLHPSGGMYVG
jgi:NAD(P)-dependent dehydrogenase (short-subunit alcohol dehydrogenase family)